MLPNFLAKLGPGKGPLPTMVGGADTADWNAIANFSGIWLTTNIRNSDQAATVPRGSINPGSLLQVSERHNRLDETTWNILERLDHSQHGTDLAVFTRSRQK